MKIKKEVVRCKDFPANCCTSCHDEWEQGFGYSIEVDLKDGRHGFVCCYVEIYLEKEGLLVDD